MSSSGNALICPGSSAQAIIVQQQVAAAAATATGVEKLDPRFAAMMSEAGIPPEEQAKLGTANCTTAALFGYVAKTEERLEKFIKNVVDLDPENKPQDAIPFARYVLVWEACRKRRELEVESAAARAVNHLPPVLALEDHQQTREAFEKALGRTLPHHKVPSENYFEKKVYEAETNFKAEPLTNVTNFAQEERQRRPEAERGSNQSMDFDNRGQPTLKTKKTDFYVPLPTDEPSLRNRFEVMAACLCMLKMRFGSHPILSSVEMSFFTDYVNWLCGEYVWGFVVKGKGGLPISCPHLGQVLAYELAVRELAVKLMKGKMGWKAAMEAAMADNDTRMLNFTQRFGMESHLPECRALTAPGLSERFGHIPTPIPRSIAKALATEEEATGSSAQATGEKSAAAKKRARAKANKKASRALTGPAAPLAIKDGRADHVKKDAHKPGGKGAKAKGGGGKGDDANGIPPIPKGITAKRDNKQLCFAYNQHRNCKMTPCGFLHACWWCGGDHAGGQKKCNNA